MKNQARKKKTIDYETRKFIVSTVIVMSKRNGGGRK